MYRRDCYLCGNDAVTSKGWKILHQVASCNNSRLNAVMRKFLYRFHCVEMSVSPCIWGKEPFRECHQEPVKLNASTGCRLHIFLQPSNQRLISVIQFSWNKLFKLWVPSSRWQKGKRNSETEKVTLLRGGVARKWAQNQNRQEKIPKNSRRNNIAGKVLLF